MKIYNKKLFVLGMYLLFLDIPTLIRGVYAGFDLMTAEWLLTFTILALTNIARALSRKDGQEEKHKWDERDNFVQIKARSRALEIGMFACFGLGFLLYLWGGVSHPEGAVFYIGFGLMSSILVLLPMNLFTFLYYEEKS